MRYIIHISTNTTPDHTVRTDRTDRMDHTDPDYPGFENCGLTYSEWLAASIDGGLAETFTEPGIAPETDEPFLPNP